MLIKGILSKGTFDKTSIMACCLLLATIVIPLSMNTDNTLFRAADAMLCVGAEANAGCHGGGEMSYNFGPPSFAIPGSGGIDETILNSHAGCDSLAPCNNNPGSNMEPYSEDSSQDEVGSSDTSSSEDSSQDEVGSSDTSSSEDSSQDEVGSSDTSSSEDSSQDEVGSSDTSSSEDSSQDEVGSSDTSSSEDSSQDEVGSSDTSSSEDSSQDEVGSSDTSSSEDSSQDEVGSSDTSSPKNTGFNVVGDVGGKCEDYASAEDCKYFAKFGVIDADSSCGQGEAGAAGCRSVKDIPEHPEMMSDARNSGECDRPEGCIMKGEDPSTWEIIKDTASKVDYGCLILLCTETTPESRKADVVNSFENSGDSPEEAQEKASQYMSDSQLVGKYLAATVTGYVGGKIAVPQEINTAVQIVEEVSGSSIEQNVYPPGSPTGPLKGATDSEIDSFISNLEGNANSGPLYQFSDEGGQLVGTTRPPPNGDPTTMFQPTENFPYQEKIVIPAAGPDGKAVELRTHSADPKFPENGYTTQINSGKKYYLPDFNSPGEVVEGKWIKLNKNTPEADIKGVHIPAGNPPAKP